MEVTRFADQAAGGGVADVRGAHTEDRYAQTAAFCVYEPSLLPGPLQSPGYAEAVQRFWQSHLQPGRDQAHHDASVAGALERHFERSAAALRARFDVVIEEAALHARVGGPAVQVHALQHLLNLMGDTPLRSTLSVAVIPQGARQRVPPTAPFWILDGEAVLLEVPSASLSEVDGSQVGAYERLFSGLAGAAVTDSAARRLVIDSMDQAHRG